MINQRDHWNDVYRSKRADQVSWYRPHLEVSLELVRNAAPTLDLHVIDVGAGESTLIDDLITLGYSDLYALDISSTALDVAKARLGVNASRVKWMVGDVRTIGLGRYQFDVWHDRAVFHFLTEAADRQAYVQQVAHAVKPGGHVIVATFGPEGPTQCSGLDVVRYDPDSLHKQFGPGFQLVDQRVEMHKTPWGTTQQFAYCLFQVADSVAHE